MQALLTAPLPLLLRAPRAGLRQPPAAASTGCRPLPPAPTPCLPPQVLDKYFGNVCELDLIFNFHKARWRAGRCAAGWGGPAAGACASLRGARCVLHR